MVLVRERGFEVSEATVGRILAYLKRRGVLKEPVRKVRARTTPRKRDYAVRKPPDYEVKEPGDLVQIDTMDVRLEPGYVFKQFTAADVISKWGFGDVRSAATSSLAREFLEELIRASPFRIEGVQVDGGSEFFGEFERACKELGICRSVRDFHPGLAPGGSTGQFAAQCERYSLAHILRSLQYFEDAEQEPELRLLDPRISWPEVKRFFRNEVLAYTRALKAGKKGFGL